MDKVVEVKEYDENISIKDALAFAWINGLRVVDNRPEDDRDHQHWLNEDYGVNEETFKNTPGGYIVKDRIQLFRCDNYMPIDASHHLSTDDIRELLLIYLDHYGHTKKSIPIFSGVFIRETGKLWPPMHKLGTFVYRSEKDDYEFHIAEVRVV